MRLTQKSFAKYVSAMATKEELALAVGCGMDFLENWVYRNFNCSYEEIAEELQAEAMLELRVQAFDLAKSGNASIVAMLAKEYLSLGGKSKAEELEQSQALEELNNIVTPME